MKGKGRGFLGHLITVCIILAAAAGSYCLATTDIYLRIPSGTDMSGNACSGAWIETGETNEPAELLLEENGRAMSKTPGRIFVWGKWNSDDEGVYYSPLLKGHFVTDEKYTKQYSVSGMAPADLGFEGEYFLAGEDRVYGLISKVAEQDKSAMEDLKQDVDILTSEDSYDVEQGTGFLKEKWTEFVDGFKELIGR